MSSKQSKKKKKLTPEEEQKIREQYSKPWISMRSGLIVITITSLAMAVLTAIQVQPARGWGEAILWGLLFGVLIWVIFWGFYFFRKIFWK